MRRPTAWREISSAISTMSRWKHVHRRPDIASASLLGAIAWPSSRCFWFLPRWSWAPLSVHGRRCAATRAETLAETARADEAAQRKIAVDQRKSADAARISEAERRNVAESERAEALKQRAAAEANFHKARAAVDEYFTLVSESTLLEVPGLQPLRKDLLEAAIRFYEKSSESRTNDPTVLADTAITYLRVGMIYFSLNRTDDSIAAIRKALNIVDRLRSEGAEAIDQLPRVAGFWRGLRWTQFLTFQPRDRIGTFATLLRLEKTWSQLAEQFPAQVAFQSDLAPVQGLIGFAFAATGRLKESEVSHRKALSLLQRLLREHPHVAQYRNDFLAGVRIMAPVVLSNGNAEESNALLREAVRIGEALVVEFPKNPNYRYQLSECHRVLGRQIESVQPYQTVQHLHRATELGQEIVREFPGIDNYYRAWHFAASGWLQWSDTLGDIVQAEKALRESMRTQELVAAYRYNDVAIHFDLAATMLELAQRVGKDPQKASEAENLRRRALESCDRTIAIFEERSAEFQKGDDQESFADQLNDIAWSLTTTIEPALRDAPRAVKLAKRAVELAPANARFWNTLGMAHYRGEEWQAAIEAFGQAIALESNNVWSFQRVRDLVSDRAGNVDQQVLIDKAEAALANDPQYVDWCAIRGRWAEATAGLKKRIEGNPDDHGSWYQAAFVLAVQGDVDKYHRHCHEDVRALRRHARSRHCRAHRQSMLDFTRRLKTNSKNHRNWLSEQ